MSEGKRKVMDGFAERLKSFRSAAGLTLEQVATASGLVETYLEQLEDGQSDDPSVRIAIKLAAVFGVPVNVLVGLDVKGRPVDDAASLDALFRDRVGREIEAMLGSEDRGGVDEFLASLGLARHEQVREVADDAERWRADSARLRSRAAATARELTQLGFIADGLLGWAGRLRRLVDEFERRPPLEPVVDLRDESEAKPS